MKYPKTLNTNSKIGVVALSAGVGYKLEEYKKSILNLEKNGFQIIETASVRSTGEVSNTALIRATEFDKLITDEDVEMVMCATGGDFLIEILPYINYENIAKNPKWIMGASDPTSLLYIITTKLDIATLYGLNAASFDNDILHESQKMAMEYIKGNYLIQKSYDKYEKNREDRTDSYNLTEEVYWTTFNGEVDIEGRIIGGCIDCLRDLPGTRFDCTKSFIEKYKEDGIIWYFDIFSLSCEDFYRTLIQLRESGWFSYVKGVIVGRVLHPNSTTEMTYEKALRIIFENLPIIMNADIGHVPPKMTIINGSIAHIMCNEGKGTIAFKIQ